MKTYNLKESLIQMDKETDFKYTLTDLYEACQLDEAKKKELVQYIDAKDPVGMNTMLCNEAGVMTENISDDIPDDEMPEELKAEGWNPNMSDCPACGDTSFDTKKGKCTKCSYKESLHEDAAKDIEEVTAGMLTRLVKKVTGLDTLKTNTTSVRGFHSKGSGSFKVTKEGYDYFRITFYRNKDEQAHVEEELISQGFEIDDMGGDILVSKYKKVNESIEEAFNEGDMVYVKPSKKSGRVVRVKGDTVEVEIMGGKDPDRRDTFYTSDLEMEKTLTESDEELDFSCYNLTDDQIEKVKYIRKHLDTVEGYRAYYELEKEITDEGGCMDIFYDLSADFAWDNRFSVAITKLALADNRPDLADPNYLPGGCYAEYMNDPKYANVLLEDVNGQHLEATLRAAAETKLAEMGYEGDFIDEYFGIKLEDTEDNRVKVTVWGELSYEESSELADVLNYIVAEEDPDAYFDHETSGRMAAYIRKDQSEDIPDEALVSEWSEKFNSCTTWEQLKDVYGEFYNIRDDLNNGTHRALYDIIDKKIDELKPVEEGLEEAFDSNIPAPYNKYYEIGINREDIPEEDIPDAFDNYKGMNLLAIVYAKEQYEDALGDNCLDYCYLVEDDQSKMIVTTAGPRVYAVELNEIERCIGDNIEEALKEDAEEAPAAIYSMLDAADHFVDNDEYPENASEEEIIEIAKNNPDCMKVTKWVDGQTGPDEVVWERPVDIWFVSQYEGGAEYEHAEGGYYYETLTHVDKETFDSKEAAQKRLAELADEARKEGEDVVAQTDDFFRIKTGRYIGDCEEYHVEAKEGAHASGKKVYEGLNEAILNEINSPEEKPYSAAEIEKEIKSLTQNFTREKDNLKCGFKEENDAAVKLLKKHYNEVNSEKHGQWFEITFSEPKKELQEDISDGTITLASDYFYDNLKNLEDAGWNDVVDFVNASGWVKDGQVIIPAGTILTFNDTNRYFDYYYVMTNAGSFVIPFNKDFTAESPLTEDMNTYNVTFYMDSLDDNVMSGPSTTKMIRASSEEEAKKKLIDSSTDKYYIPTVTKVELVESTSMSADEMKAKHGTDNPDIINAGKEEKDRVTLKEDQEGIEWSTWPSGNKTISRISPELTAKYFHTLSVDTPDEIVEYFIRQCKDGRSIDRINSLLQTKTDNNWRGEKSEPYGGINYSDATNFIKQEIIHIIKDDMSRWIARWKYTDRDMYNQWKHLEESVETLTEAMIYTDTNGFLGEPGETYTMSQFRRMWQDKDNDPVMSGYDSFEEWVGETISQMDAHEEEVAPSGRGMASCKIWKDTNGVMGTPGEEYTLNDLADYWTNNNGSDPVLAEYKGDWKAWLDATIPQMEERIDDSLYCEGLESKTFTDKEEAKKFAKDNKGAITSVVDDKLNPIHYVHYKGKKEPVEESLFEESLAEGLSYDKAENLRIQLAKPLKLSDYEAEMFEHDINNGREDEWKEFVEALPDSTPGKKEFLSMFQEEDSIEESFEDMLNDPEVQRRNAAYADKMKAKHDEENELAKEAKNWPDDKELTYEEAMAFAKAYYSQGGDGFYETTEKYQFDDMVDMFGPMTVGSMKRDFNIFGSVAKDRMAEGIQLTEAPEKYELLIEPYVRYEQAPLVKKTFNSNSLAKVLETIANRWMYGFDPIERAADEGWECETREEAIEALQKEYDKDYTQILIDELEGCNGDGCGFIFYLKNLTTGDMIIDSGIEPEEEEEDLFESAEEASDDYILSVWNDDELVKDNVWSVSDALEFIHDNGGNIIKVTDHEGERIIWKDGKAVGGGFIGKDIDEYGVTSYFEDGEDVPTHKGAEPFNAWEWMYGKQVDESFKTGDRVKQTYANPYNVGKIINTKQTPEEGNMFQVKWDYSDGDDIEWVNASDISRYNEDDEKAGHYE